MTIARILIVEDENIVALDMKAGLMALGHSIAGIATTGEQAIQIARETSPDLILMDVKLKGDMDGVQAAAQIRAHTDVPLIYLTAFADENTVNRAKVTEPHGYLLKPFEEDELRTTIEMALYKYQMEKRLKESEQWLATTLRSIGDAVIATDAHGRIKLMNPVAETLTGWQQDEVLGKNAGDVFKIINEHTRADSVSPIDQALLTGEVVFLANNTLLITKEGLEIPIDDSAAPIKDDKDHINGAVLVFRDVTQQKLAEKQLRQYSLELETRNAELDAFARMVAHDVKSPLAPIQGIAEVLIEDCHKMPPEDMRFYLASITRNSQKITNIVNELLLLAQMRATEVELKPLDMKTISDEAIHRLNYLMEEYQAEVSNAEAAGWPAALGYAPWIEQVWVNYISNGIKYGGSPPRLALGAARQADNMIRFWVKDNGPGLTPEAQAQLFTPFVRLAQTRAKGHGLGLSIVQNIIEKLGGQIGVDSNGVAGEGSLFYFTLPAQEI